MAIEDSPDGVTSAEVAGFRRVIVVPSDVPVPTGPIRLFRGSLTQVSTADYSG
ncbi:hypothetical protein LWC34_32470 [Kibdelosporangium philippinense]|uniref:Uncharacterized protein n=1 Tax=Kibdelosporangium philippinense TaxID=211113 RepID=A0ABS8ZI65_9PSEU|nr:hypothetical protein [Kibdelosporangium philippinense]MCE7007500.1 hypothetical protein [Kibdelosporangium philippinense]